MCKVGCLEFIFKCLWKGLLMEEGFLYNWKIGRVRCEVWCSCMEYYNKCVGEGRLVVVCGEKNLVDEVEWVLIKYCYLFFFY